MLLINFIFLLFLNPQKPLPTIHEFKIASVDGDTIDFSQFKGKKILIVNTASECMYTPQYEGLQKLYEAYHDKLVIVGFPSNDFLGQEPGSNSEIRQFCSSNYHITFPMTEKVVVKGRNKTPVYQWLTERSLNGVENSKVSWNFNKYLLNERGEYVQHFGSNVEPEDPALLAALLK